jgi:large subunit ribosomal protein L6
MLRNFNRPIKVNGFTCKKDEGKEVSKITFTGKNGSLQLDVPNYINFSIEKDEIVLGLNRDLVSNQEKAMTGTVKALTMSYIKGVTEFHSRIVIFTGTGCNVKVVGDKLVMKIGKSHLVERVIPQGINCAIASSDIKETKLKVHGIDACAVGQFSKELCDLVKNRYKGGIHIWIEGKEVPLKEGKNA